MLAGAFGGFIHQESMAMEPHLAMTGMWSSFNESAPNNHTFDFDPSVVIECDCTGA